MRTDSLDWASKGIDLDRPNVARVYDYLLGGGCNFPRDRELGDQLMAAVPELEVAARHNRAFLRRAVRFCVANGIRQFLDLGSGIPTVGNVHEVAQRDAPDARVVYVDKEPVAVATSELMLDDNDNVDVVLADLLEPEFVLGSPQARRLLNLDEPVAVLMLCVLHFIPDSAGPHEAIAQYLRSVAPGSYLVLSHAATGSLSSPKAAESKRLYDSSNSPGLGRTREQVAELMAGTELVEPGIVWTGQWRPDDAVDHSPGLSIIHAAVGRKPTRHAGNSAR
ncbi:MAG: SAM-dependent methyltransferase [Labedaea sp.]